MDGHGDGGSRPAGAGVSVKGRGQWLLQAALCSFACARVPGRDDEPPLPLDRMQNSGRTRTGWCSACQDPSPGVGGQPGEAQGATAQQQTGWVLLARAESSQDDERGPRRG